MGQSSTPARILWDRWIGEEQRMIGTPPEVPGGHDVAGMNRLEVP